MRQSQNSRRPRGRSGNNRNQGGRGNSGGRASNNQQSRNGGSNPNRQYDSHGPDGKNRGTAAQLAERYKGLAREFASADRTLAEAFSQFADHYGRVAAEIAGAEAEQAARREAAREQQQRERSNDAEHSDQAGNGAQNSGVATHSASAEAGSDTPPRRVPRPRRDHKPDRVAPSGDQKNNAEGSPVDAAPIAVKDAEKPRSVTPEAGGDAEVSAPVAEKPRRGRPRKTAAAAKEVAEKPAPKKPKSAVPDTKAAAPDTETNGDVTVEIKPKRRGRPRKVSAPEPETVAEKENLLI